MKRFEIEGPLCLGVRVHTTKRIGIDSPTNIVRQYPNSKHSILTGSPSQTDYHPVQSNWSGRQSPTMNIRGVSIQGRDSDNASCHADLFDESPNRSMIRSPTTRSLRKQSTSIMKDLDQEWSTAVKQTPQQKKSGAYPIDIFCRFTKQSILHDSMKSTAKSNEFSSEPQRHQRGRPRLPRVNSEDAIPHGSQISLSGANHAEVQSHIIGLSGFSKETKNSYIKLVKSIGGAKFNNVDPEKMTVVVCNGSTVDAKILFALINSRRFVNTRYTYCWETLH